MLVCSPTNEYTIITRFPDGRRFRALDGQGREFVIVVEEDPNKAKRIVPMLMEWKRIAEFSDFHEFFPYKGGIAAVFAGHAGGEKLENALADMPYPQRAEALKGVFALILRQCLPDEILCGVLRLDNLRVFPSGKVELTYDLPQALSLTLKDTVSGICGDCSAQEIDSLYPMIEDIMPEGYERLYEAAQKAADKLASYSPQAEPEAQEPPPKEQKDQRVPEGYIAVGSRYVSKAFLMMLSLGLFALAVLYVTALHPVLMQKLYDVMSMPVFKLNSPYLEAYAGNARLTLADGTTVYEGRVEQSAANGEGRRYENGELVYEGGFELNKASGHGKLYRNGALVYEGEFLDGDCTGTGKLFNEDGSLLYDGGFLAGVYEGEGKLYQEGQLIYEGGFVLGRYEGKGKRYQGGELVYEGDFVSGLYEGIGKHYQKGELLYEGGFASDLYEGEGKHYQGGELVYDGGFASGLYEGNGKHYQGGVLLYEGGFASGVYEGEGKLYKDGALLYEGGFANGKYNGTGSEYNTRTGHFVFTGRYLAGKRMEAGTSFDENGRPVVTIKGPEPRPEPLSLLGLSYEDAMETLKLAEVSIVEQTAGDELLAIDEAIELIYGFELTREGKPDSLTRLYYYGIASVDGVVIGADVLDIKGGKDVKGSLSASELLVLGYSNMKWGRDAESSKLRSMIFSGDGRSVTAFYLPSDPPAPEVPMEEEAEEAAQDKAQNATAEEKPAAEPVEPSGRILFLRVVYSTK